MVELEAWPDDAELLKITRDIGQPVTSFVVLSEARFHIRWFSLQSEINLCGHGSLGAGAAILARYKMDEMTFHNRYGDVTVSKRDHLFGIALPAWKPLHGQLPEEVSVMRQQAIDTFTTRDVILVLPDEAAVASFKPDFEKLEDMAEYHALIVTAQSGEHEYVLRYFAPKIGIEEDLATGSAQCSLAPYWFGKLGRNVLSVRQLSSTGGYFEIERESDATIRVYAHVSLRR